MTTRLEHQTRLEADRREADAMRPPNGPQTLGEYMMPPSGDPTSGVVLPEVRATNFELKSGLLNMIQANQFGGFPTEDPHQHMETFLDLMSTVKIHQVSQDAIRLYAFRFSLHSKARAWYKSLPENSIRTWNELYEAFMAKLFPPKKTAEMRAKISAFVMQ